MTDFGEAEARSYLIEPSIVLVRRIARQAIGGVRLLADNPTYAEEMVPSDRLGALTVIGRVVWLGCAQ